LACRQRDERSTYERYHKPIAHTDVHDFLFSRIWFEPAFTAFP